MSISFAYTRADPENSVRGVGVLTTFEARHVIFNIVAF